MIENRMISMLRLETTIAMGYSLRMTLLPFVQEYHLRVLKTPLEK